MSPAQATNKDQKPATNVPDTDTKKPVDHMLDDAPVAPGTRGAAPEDVSDLQLPHERDQSTRNDSTGGMGTGAAGDRQREVLQQAHQDLKQGQVDTDMRATPGLDAQQRQGMVDDPKSAPSPRGSVAEHGKQDRR